MPQPIAPQPRKHASRHIRPGTQTYPLREIVEAAAKAPSSHNSQPWMYRIGGDYVDVFADRTRALPVVDPYDRELTISCGATVGFIEVVGGAKGYQTRVRLTPSDDDPDFLARVDVKPDGDVENMELMTLLSSAIPQRCTNRQSFRMEPVPEDVIAICTDLCEQMGIIMAVAESDAHRRAIAALVAEGDRLQFADPRFRRELAAWVHSSRLGSRDGMSGTAFAMPDLLSPLGGLVIRTFDVGDGVAAADEEKIIDGSPALMVLSSAEDAVDDWINTGRALARVLLLLSARGLSASYLNQPIETETLLPRLQAAIRSEAYPQILLRVGYAKEDGAATVRRPLDEMLIADD